MTRPDWDTYYLGIAAAVALRGECSRRQVGAVLVGPDKRIRSTGYNGAAAGAPSCLQGACPRATSGVAPGSSYDTGAGSCIALHAEQNAVLEAPRESRAGSTVYVSAAPCDGCRRLLRGSGVSRVVWFDGEEVF